MKICKNCGTRSDDFSVYCSECGMLLDENNTVYENEPQQAQNTTYQYAQPSQTQSPYGQQGANNAQYYQSQSAYQNQNAYQSPYQYQPQAQNGAYGYSPYYTQQPLKKPKSSKGKVIACLIVSIIFGGLPAIILAVIALISYGNYESAAAKGDITQANENCEKIRKCSTAAWVFAIIGIVFSVIIFIITFVGAIGFISDGVFDDIFDSDEDFFYEDFFESYLDSEYEYPDFGSEQLAVQGIGN